MKRYKRKYILTSALISFVCAFWHIVWKLDFGEGFTGIISSIWNSGTAGEGGGLIGGLIAFPMLKLLSFWGSIIILIPVILILILCVFEISVEKTITCIKGLFEKDYEAMDEEDVEKVPEGMPPEMKRELKKIKQQIFDFEKEFR